MRMQPCPYCGAVNSVKRATCYQCQRELVRERPVVERAAPASRWEAIETGRPPTAEGVPPAINETTPQASSAEPRAPAAPRPRRYASARRRALSHVRTMGVFFRELHALTRAGIAIGPACRELERRAPSGVRSLALEMAAAAEKGQPVSSALAAHPALIYPWHLGIIRAAEAGGFLPDAFEQIARAYETEWEIRSALRLRIFVYVGLGLPAVLVSAPLFLTLAQPIPRDGWTPDLVIATILHFFKVVSLPAALGLLALLGLWQMLQSFVWFQALQQRLVIHLPVVGSVARAAALDRYLATLGLMLRGGIPIAQAAEEAATAAGNAAVTPKLLELVPALRQGQSLSNLLAGTRLFGADTLQMTATGEISGALPDMLARAANYYQQENAGKRRVLLRLAQVLFGVLWLVVLGGLFLLGVRLYFDFALRTYEWMMEGFE